MKRALLVAICSLGLLACGTTSDTASSVSDSTVADSTATTNAAVDTTSTVATTTTIAVSTIDEKVVECDEDTIGADMKTKVRMDKCTENFGIGNTDKNTWNCPDDGCREASLFKRVNGTWSTNTMCRKDQPMVKPMRLCYRTDKAAVATDEDLFPPKIACTLWDANSELRFVAYTGCEPSAEAIKTSLTRKCQGEWVQNEYLPFETCDSGTMVKRAQKVMKAAGLTTELDGFYGSDNAKQIAAFQEKNGLRKTGMLDIETWKKLIAISPVKGSDRDGDGVITPDEM